MRRAHSNRGGRRNIGRNVDARAEVVAPIDGRIGLINIVANLDGTIANAITEVPVPAQASNIVILATKFGSQTKHVVAAESLSSFLLSIPVIVRTMSADRENKSRSEMFTYATVRHVGREIGGSHSCGAGDGEDRSDGCLHC